jgi:serine/threonine protein kinase/Tol biopolymer transport system component
MGLTSGTKLGPYEIVSPLGAGGMGEVYRARDTRLERDVAIKVLPSNLSSDLSLRQRLEREAKAVSKLSHPHICTLHDIGHQDGVDFLVMELVEGETLEHRLLKGPLPAEQTVRFAAQVADALAKAHKLGFVHRDLKPANVMLTKSGAKLMDFGLAKQSGSAPLATALTEMTMEQPKLTSEGMLVGTYQYMAPEQLEGKEADARTDIFSLGELIYEMATGKPAFSGKSRASLIAAILTTEPQPMVALQPMTPPGLERIVKKCLAKDPDDRWQSACDLRTNLEWVAECESLRTSSTVKHNLWRERAAWLLAAALLSALAFFAAVHYRPSSNAEPARFSVYPPENAAFSGTRNITVQIPQFALSPDGRAMVFVAKSPGADPTLWLRSVEQVAARTLPGTEGAELPFWSPDNRWVGFFAEGKLKKILVSGGLVQVLAEVPDPFGGTWGGDDSILFTRLNSSIFRVSSAGGDVTSVTELNPSHQEAAHRWPQFLPDGRHYFFHVHGSLAEYRGIYVGSLDGGIKKFLKRSDTSGAYAWPGYLLYLDGDTLLGQAFDQAHLELRGEPFTVAEQVGRSSAYSIAVSTSGTGMLAHAAAILQRGRLTWFDRAGNSLGSVGVEGDYTDFRLSPNGETLAVSLVDPKMWNPDVWLIDLTRGSRSRFTFGSGLNASPTWSPDSTRILFRTNRNGSTELYERSAGGGGNEQVVLLKETMLEAGIESPNVVPSDWSPNGRYFMLCSPEKATGYDLWLEPLGGDRKPVKFLGSPSDQIHANFSPDGSFVAYSSNESGRFQVYVQTFPLSNRKWQVSTDGGYEPRWRADGHEIYYLSDDRKLMAVSVGVGPAFAVPKLLFQTRVPEGVTSRRTHYVPSRDGKRFLINTQTSDTLPNPITVVFNWQTDLRK